VTRPDLWNFRWQPYFIVTRIKSRNRSSLPRFCCITLLWLPVLTFKVKNYFFLFFRHIERSVSVEEVRSFRKNAKPAGCQRRRRHWHVRYFGVYIKGNVGIHLFRDKSKIVKKSAKTKSQTSKLSLLCELKENFNYSNIVDWIIRVYYTYYSFKTQKDACQGYIIDRAGRRETDCASAILCPRLGAEWIGRTSWLPRAPFGPIFMTLRAKPIRQCATPILYFCSLITARDYNSGTLGLLFIGVDLMSQPFLRNWVDSIQL